MGAPQQHSSNMADPSTASTSNTEETVLPIPDLSLAQHRFILSQDKLKHLHDASKKALKEGIEKDEMAQWLLSDPLLSASIDDDANNPSEGSLYKSLKAKNDEKLKELEDKITEAERDQGETELSDALRAKATYIARIGEKDKALEAYEFALSKQAGLGSKIDLSLHSRYYTRELRIKAYAQLLESYRSVTLKSLADAFGVSESFIEGDLARFISAGRLNCSIDKVNGIVETNRPDLKNARYEQTIKQGDILLNSLQKLSRVIG